jgi:hypothetical protein
LHVENQRYPSGSRSTAQGSAFSVLTGQSIDDHLAVIGSNGQVDFGLPDAINSTVATVDQTGQAGGQFLYDPFGQTSALGGNYPFQFTGSQLRPDWV